MLPIVVLTDERCSELVDAIHRTPDVGHWKCEAKFFPRQVAAFLPTTLPTLFPSLWIPERTIWVRRWHRVHKGLPLNLCSGQAIATLRRDGLGHFSMRTGMG